MVVPSQLQLPISRVKVPPGELSVRPVAQGSGVLVTEGREFPTGKATGRNASEPICSLVSNTEGADPVDVWGRPLSAEQGNGSGLLDLPG